MGLGLGLGVGLGYGSLGLGGLCLGFRNRRGLGYKIRLGFSGRIGLHGRLGLGSGIREEHIVGDVAALGDHGTAPGSPRAADARRTRNGQTKDRNAADIAVHGCHILSKLHGVTLPELDSVTEDRELDRSHGDVVGGQGLANAVIGGKLGKAQALNIDVHVGSKIRRGGVEAHALLKELAVVGKDDLVGGIAVTAYHIAGVGIVVHPVQVTDISVVAADQLLRLGKSCLIGIQNRFSFLGRFLLDRFHGQAGIAPYTRVTGMAVLVLLYQFEGTHTLYRTG